MIDCLFGAEGHFSLALSPDCTRLERMQGQEITKSKAITIVKQIGTKVYILPRGLNGSHGAVVGGAPYG